MELPRRFAPWLTVAGLMALAACSSSSDSPTKTQGWPTPDPVSIQPAGFTTMPVPADNPLTKQGIALGRRLFFDPILSGDSTESCGTCHEPGRAFSDDRRFSIGIDLKEGTRNAPAVINAAWLKSAFWDGRATSLEDQALQPVVNPIEMHETWPNVVSKVQNHPDYPALFGAAFGTDQVTRELVVKAIGQFERTLISNNSKFDTYLATRDTQAAGFSAAATRGFAIFNSERGDCFHCHEVNALLTDNNFHNVGLDSNFTDPGVDLGLGNITGNPDDMAKFKTPTLRNVEYTAPYMHDGRFATLPEVVEHYNSGGKATPTTDPFIRTQNGLGLTPSEVNDVVEFLKTFSDPDYLTNPDYQDPNN
jgi:cytochrome c peroxidase